MKIGLSTKVTINLGNYESLAGGCSIEDDILEGESFPEAFLRIQRLSRIGCQLHLVQNYGKVSGARSKFGTLKEWLVKRLIPFLEKGEEEILEQIITGGDYKKEEKK